VAAHPRLACYAEVVPSQPARLLELARSHSGDREVTLYIKGFLARDEKPDDFDAWLASHRKLEQSHGWGPRVRGYCWPSGRLATVPLPVAATAKVAWDLYRRSRVLRLANVVGSLGLTVGEVALRLASQYLIVSRSLTESADHLAHKLTGFAARYDRVRVVAHSLGCRQIIEAASRLRPERRPHEIHLCAGACREEDVAIKLPHLAREHTYQYYTTDDLVLRTAFTAMAWGRALGTTELRRDYPGLTAIDVSDHFGFRVHGEYKHRFPDFAA
jgi:hypothetical protein